MMCSTLCLFRGRSESTRAFPMTLSESNHSACPWTNATSPQLLCVYTLIDRTLCDALQGEMTARPEAHAMYLRLCNGYPRAATATYLNGKSATQNDWRKEQWSSAP